MQFTIYINQAKAKEWGLNLPQAFLFSFIFSARKWSTKQIIDGESWHWLASGKIIEELPLLTEKTDTIRHISRALEQLGVVKRATIFNQSYYCITEKGEQWSFVSCENERENNPDERENNPDERENNPDEHENNPDEHENNPESREKNHTNQYTTDNQSLNKTKNKQVSAPNALNIPFVDFWNLYGKKVGSLSKVEKKWTSLTNKEREQIMLALPAYIESTPEKKFRKNPETYLNNKSWNDEIITGGQHGTGDTNYESALSSTDWLTTGAATESSIDGASSSGCEPFIHGIQSDVPEIQRNLPDARIPEWCSESMASDAY